MPKPVRRLKNVRRLVTAYHGNVSLRRLTFLRRLTGFGISCYNLTL